MSERANSVKLLLLLDGQDEDSVELVDSLRQADRQLLTANSARTALDVLHEHDLALALVDLQALQRQGVEFIEQLEAAARSRGVPLIFLGAGASEARPFQGPDAGIVAYLCKPIERSVLQHKVQVFTHLHRQRMRHARQLEVFQRQQAEMRALEDDLWATLRMNEMFVATMSHDLRSPLNAMLMATELLLVRHPASEDRRLVERAQASARRLAHLIDQFQDLTRARPGGAISVTLATGVDARAIAEQVVHGLSVANPERRVTLRAQGDTVGNWDERRLERVLAKLIGNAVRHGTPETPIDVKIQGGEREHVELSVTNCGAIASNLLPTLFSPFSPATDGQRGSEQGLGLGLFIVAEIVRAHGGQISVHAAEDLTTFQVRLPRAHAASPKSEAQQER